MKFSIGAPPLKRFLFSIILAFLITMVLSGVLAVIFSFFHPPEGIFSFICRFIGFLSSFIAAFLCARSIEKNGLFTGIISAGLYMLILFICGIIFMGNSFSVHALMKLLGIASVCGALGGVMGINIKK